MDSDYREEWQDPTDVWAEWIGYEEPFDEEPRPVVRIGKDPIGWGGFALPTMTLHLLLIGAGSVLVALWEAARPVTLIVGGGVLLLRWGWKSYRAVTGYSRGRK